VTDAVNYERLLLRVDGIVEKQAELTERLNNLTSTLENRYLTRELYVSQREADRQDVADVSRRLDTADQNRAADRRLIFASFVGPLLIGLLMLYVAAQIGGNPT
jgi:hypothetical protein